MSTAQEANGFVADIIYRAVEIAHQHGHEYTTLEHLLASLLEVEDVKTCLKAMNVDYEQMYTDLMSFFVAILETVPGATPSPTKGFDEVIMRCVGTAMFTVRANPSGIDLLLHLSQYPSEDSHAVTLMQKYGITTLAIKQYISHTNGPVSSTSTGGRPGMAEGGEPGVANEPTTPEEAERILEKYCENLNRKAKALKIDPLIGRANEVGDITRIVSRRTKNNVVLVGEPGVGKTAIAEGLALKIVRGEVPATIKDSTVYSLDIASLVAGTRYRGDFEERMKLVLKSFKHIPNSILFIDEIHTIMGAGSGNSGSLDVANLIKPALADGYLRCIGSTTLDEFRKHFEKDRALLRRFKKVDVGEPSPEDSKLILRGLRDAYEGFHGVKFTDAAIDAAVDLTHRYVMHAYLPDKAIDVLDNAGARQRILPESERKTLLDVADIEMEVASVARIPTKDVQEGESEKLIKLDTDLKGAVFGQDGAINELVDAVFVSRAGLRSPNKPLGSYLFTGPTGVGKTEIARQLAKTLGVPLLKFDMSEYVEKHNVSRLIGAPPGYVGFGDGAAGNGSLCNDVDANPYCVLLLDEIEKAHPDVFNVLLQVMDYGTLTSGSGKTINFRNVILIMTSNAGAAELTRNKIGFGSNVNVGGDDPVIERMFTPEFRNRLDAIVKFDRLKQEHILMVVDKFLAELSDMVTGRAVTLDVPKETKEWLAAKGFDPAMGARPLARVIHEHIKKPLSRLLLIGSLKNGGVAHVNVVDDKIVVS